MMISLSIIATQQEASAAQPKEWCFGLVEEGVPTGTGICFPTGDSSSSRRACSEIQPTNPDAVTPCRPRGSFH
jgi:hypothetical protein